MRLNESQAPPSQKFKKEIKIALETNEMRTQQLKPMGHCKSSAQGKVHINTGSPQETKKQVK